MNKREQQAAAMVAHVIELMETKGVDWSSGWKDMGVRPHNVHSGHVYTGWNSFWLAMMGASHVSTFKGWQALGYSCKGLSGKGITVTQPRPRFEENEKGESVQVGMFWKAITVFRAQDVKHFETGEPYVPADIVEAVDKTEILERADEFFQAVGVEIIHSSTEGAYYSPKDDHIVMPMRERFEGTATSSPTECYYSTLAHEAIHFTGHKSRLDRLSEYGTKAGRAREELIAEFGSILLSQELGIEAEPREDHAAYLEGWLKALKGKNAFQYLTQAAGAAQEAIEELEKIAGVTTSVKKAA